MAWIPNTHRILRNKEKMLSYLSRDLLWRLKKRYHLSDPRDLFKGMLQFLYLKAVANEPISPTKDIAAAWRMFVLDTKAYQRFCDEYVGEFIDYIPVTARTNRETYKMQKNLAIELAKKEFGELSNCWSPHQSTFEEGED